MPGVGEHRLAPGAEQTTDVVGVPVCDDDRADVPRSHAEPVEFFVEVPGVELAGEPAQTGVHEREASDRLDQQGSEPPDESAVLG